MEVVVIQQNTTENQIVTSYLSVVLIIINNQKYYLTMDNVILTPIAVESLIDRIATRTFELLNKSQTLQKTESKLYSVKELAKYAGVSELSIRNYIKEGKIKAKQIGRRILIDEKQFEAGLIEVKSLKYKR